MKRTSAFLITAFLLSAFSEAKAALTCEQLFATQPASALITKSPEQVVADLIKAKEQRMLEAQKHMNKEDFISVDLMDPANELMLFFRSRDQQMDENNAGIASIIKNGFLSTFETGTSNSSNLDLAPRLEVEKITAGVSLKVEDSVLANLPEDQKKAWLSLHPKSMIVNLATPPEFDAQVSTPSYYGDVAAVFKNDLKKRAIWTSDDSLNFLRNPYGPETENFEALNKKAVEEHSGVFTKNALLPKNPFRGGRDGNPLGWYYETQVYGPITAEDVVYLMVSRRDYVKSLEHFQKPIYLLESDVSLHRTVFRKGELLYSPK